MAVERVIAIPDNPEEVPSTKLVEPKMITVDRALNFVRGAGGMSGQDNQAYYYFGPDE